MRPTKKFFITLGIVFWISASAFAVLPSWPHLYYRLLPQTSGTLASTIASTVSEMPTPSITPSAPEEIVSTPLPDIDPSLPKDNGLIIDKIGVRGEIHEGTDWENILKQGIWRAPDFGTPEDTSSPIIIAAHRWGYLEWTPAFRKLNSFYSLPQLAIDDTISLIWDQRPYKYKVYATETGTKISDYQADLILYTCQLWNSPVRFFVYANRI